MKQIPPSEAWQRVEGGDLRVLDLRTRTERQRFGAPPGAPKVSLLRHVLWPRSVGYAYLCQHAKRSKLTAWRGASEIEGGWSAWREAGLPVERH